MRSPVFRVLPYVLAAFLIILEHTGALAANAEEISHPDWREQNAYTLGVQAYIYAFPWAYMPNARWLRTEAIDRQADRFDHIRHLARLGIGPGLDVDAQDASTKRGLARAAIDGERMIADAFADGYLQKAVNGWNYPPPATGRPSPTRDWMFRALQMLAGFVANDPVEATYLNVSVDGEGKPLTGKNSYVIHFDEGGEPKVKAFWSITMYNPQYNLVANPLIAIPSATGRA